MVVVQVFDDGVGRPGHRVDLGRSVRVGSDPAHVAEAADIADLLDPEAPEGEVGEIDVVAGVGMPFQVGVPHRRRVIDEFHVPDQGAPRHAEGIAVALGGCGGDQQAGPRIPSGVDGVLGHVGNEHHGPAPVVGA